jgi:hypothetical protein
MRERAAGQRAAIFTTGCLDILSTSEFAVLVNALHRKVAKLEDIQSPWLSVTSGCSGLTYLIS